MLFEKREYLIWFDFGGESRDIEHLHFNNQFFYHLGELK